MQPTTLSNPDANKKFVTRVMADIDDETFNYFFDPTGPCVFTGCRGVRQAIVSQFFTKLKEFCVAEGVRAEWQPDNEARVQDILNRIILKPKRKKK